jgi:hypothetical protein
MKLSFFQEQALYALIMVAMTLAAGWYATEYLLSVAPCC